MDQTLWSRTPLAARPSRYDTGAFAIEDIEQGTIVIPEWNEASDGKGWIRLDRRQVQRLPPDARALFRRYGLDTDFDEILGPLDISFVTDPDNFINHSCDPNLRYDSAGNVVAARDIRKGEEVFIDYGFFVVNFDEPFTCSCGAQNCRGRITRQDWRKLAATYGMNMPRFLHSRIASMKNGRRGSAYAAQAMLPQPNTAAVSSGSAP
jgi:SET domain